MSEVNQKPVQAKGRFLGSQHRAEKETSDQWNLAFAYLTPALILLVILVVIPMGYAFFISLSDMSAEGGKFVFTFSGLENYEKLFTDARFISSLPRTLIFTVLRVGGAFLFGLGVALIINKAFLAARILKFLFLIPWALSFVVTGLMWMWMYNTDYGVINAILDKLGLIKTHISFLGSPDIAIYAVTVIEAWKAIPFITLVLLSGLKSIPQDLYEAAEVDGANTLQRFRFVTLPSLRPVILVTLVIQTMWSIKAFASIWTTTQGGPMDSTMLLNIYAYQQSFQFLNLDYGAALSFVVTIIILSLTVTYIALIGIDE